MTDLVVNGAARAVAPGTRLDRLVAELGAPATGTAVAVNGEVVPRIRWDGHELSDGDRVEVVTAVQGG